MKQNVGFIGLGKLGLPCALALSHAINEKVVGYDINSNVIDYIQDKKVPYVEQDLDKFFHYGDVSVVSSIDEVVKYSNIIFFAIQTPHNHMYEGNTPVPHNTQDFDYEYLKKAFKETCLAIEKQVKEDVLLVVISTVLPGTMRRELLPLISEIKVKVQFCYNPFFIAMGTTIHDFLNPEFVLIGSDDSKSMNRLEKLYSFINAPKIKMQIESAELTKVAYNTFIGFKIVFANTIAEICSKVGGDSDEVTDALAAANARLMSGKYLRAGMADGGGCHPRDQIAMSHLSKTLDLSVNTFDWLANARDSQTKRQMEIVNRFHKETNLPVVLLGKSYKKNVNLTVGSPADLLAHMLAQAEIDFTFYDPIVWPGQLEPGYPAVYFISCNHDLFKNLRLPKGSICIDPWGDAWIKTEEVRHIRIGREVLFN